MSLQFSCEGRLLLPKNNMYVVVSSGEWEQDLMVDSKNPYMYWSCPLDLLGWDQHVAAD